LPTPSQGRTALHDADRSRLRKRHVAPEEGISRVDQLVPGDDEVDGHGDAGSSTLPSSAA
jgi:hypothetical protein